MPSDQNLMVVERQAWVVVEPEVSCSIWSDVGVEAPEQGAIEMEAKCSIGLKAMVEPVEERIDLVVWWKNERVSQVEERGVEQVGAEPHRVLFRSSA